MKQYTITLSAILFMGIGYSPLCCAGIPFMEGKLIERTTNKIEEDTGRSTARNQIYFVEQDNRKEQITVYQSKMDAVVNKLFENGDIQSVTVQLAEIDTELTGFYQQYWKAYLYYYEAAFYQTVAHKDKEAEKAIDKSLALLQEQSHENSEYYALLALCTSFSIQYVNILKLSKVSAAVIEYGQKALALNKSNLRAYFVLASHNYHTPEMFGGMKKVEEYAVKGLACPDRLESIPQAPSWGRTQLYQLLVGYYEKEGRTKDLEQLKNNYTSQL